MRRIIKSLVRFLADKKLLAALFASSVFLLAVCLVLLSELKATYTEYRHFRSLPVGTSLAAEASPTEKSVVLFGDSRIETWYPFPYSDKYTFINAGVTGETTSEMLRRFERDVVRLQPDYVLIQAGVNDLTAAITKGIKEPQLLVDTMHQNLRYFIKTLEAQNIDVVVTSILPAEYLNFVRKQFWHDTLYEHINDANIKLKETTLSLDADWLDLDPLYRDKNGDPINKLFANTLHINQKGYQLLNKRLKEYIDNL